MLRVDHCPLPHEGEPAIALHLKTKPLLLVEHSTMSSYREMLLEHLFLGELLRHLWKQKCVHAEILTPQTDDAGYDCVVECNHFMRHIQLKTSHRKAATSRITVHRKLSEKPSGCVIWIRFDNDTLELGPFWWFGQKPGKPLPSLAEFKTAKHTKGNSAGVKTERPHLCVVPKNRFERVEKIPQLVERLFGLASPK